MDSRVLFQDFWVLFRLICILAEDLSLFYKYYSRKIYLLQFMYTLKNIKFSIENYTSVRWIEIHTAQIGLSEIYLK